MFAIALVKNHITVIACVSASWQCILLFIIFYAKIYNVDGQKDEVVGVSVIFVG